MKGIEVKAHALKSIVIALGVATCGAALAVEEEAPRTRAEVVAERNAALASGWVAAMMGEDSGSFHLARQPWVSTRTRAEVMAELKAARADGTLAELNSEAGGPIYARVQTASSVTRAQVREELRQALASGEVAATHSEAGEAATPLRMAMAFKRYAGPSPGRDAVPALLAGLAGNRD